MNEPPIWLSNAKWSAWGHVHTSITSHTSVHCVYLFIHIYVCNNNNHKKYSSVCYPLCSVICVTYCCNACHGPWSWVLSSVLIFSNLSQFWSASPLRILWLPLEISQPHWISSYHVGINLFHKTAEAQLDTVHNLVFLRSLPPSFPTPRSS